MRFLIITFLIFGSVSGLASVRCHVGNEQVDKIDLKSTVNPQVAEVTVLNSKNQVVLRGPMSVADTKNKSTIFVRNAWNWQIEISQYRELLRFSQVSSVKGQLTIYNPSLGKSLPFSMKCQRN